jgi:hypothetical protein
MIFASFLRRFAERLLVPLVLLALTILLTRDCYFPLRSLPNPASDQGQMLWNLWHTLDSVLSGKDPYLTKDLLYPAGANLATHTLVAGLWPLTLAVKLALRLVGAPVNLYPFVAYKIAILACFWLLATFTWLFFRRLGATHLEAFILAVGYGFTSFYRMHAVHLNHLCGFFFPLSGLALLALVKRPTAKTAIVAGFTVGVSIYFTEFFLFICMGVAIYVAILIARAEGRDALKSAIRGIGSRRLLATLTIFVVTLLPFIAHWAANDALPPETDDTFSANLVGYFVPSPNRTSLYIHVIPNLDSEIRQGLGGEEVFVGFPLLTLGILGWPARNVWSRAAKWTAVVFFVLALGPHLLIFSTNTKISLPFHWLNALPVMRQNRTPVRFVSAAMFFWTTVAFSGLRRMQAAALSSSGRRRAQVALTACALWVVGENYGHSELVLRPAAALETFGMNLKARMDLPPGAVLNLPLSVDDFGLHSALQIFHGRPIATGYLARYNAHQMEVLKSLDQRMAGEGGEVGPWLTSTGFATVMVGGPIAIVQQQQLHAVSLKVIFLNGRSDRQALATYGSPSGVGDFPDKWRPEDRLTETRTYETGAVRAKQVDVLADDNDTYVIDIVADDGAKASLLIPAVWGGGLRWRALDLPPAMAGRPIQRIEIRPGQGDGVFAVRALVLGG